ncbi:MAG: hypothetical protein V2B19_32455 [Pseudomonadota bacterium]
MTKKSLTEMRIVEGPRFYGVRNGFDYHRINDVTNLVVSDTPDQDLTDIMAQYKAEKEKRRSQIIERNESIEKALWDFNGLSLTAPSCFNQVIRAGGGVSSWIVLAAMMMVSWMPDSPPERMFFLQ